MEPVGTLSWTDRSVEITFLRYVLIATLQLTTIKNACNASELRIRRALVLNSCWVSLVFITIWVYY